MSKSFWSNWVFWKPSKNKASDVEIAKQARINEMLAEPTTLQNQYKLMTVRAIMVTHENGEFKPNIGMPECLLWDMRRRMSNVGLLVENGWYNPKWIFNSTVDHINIDYDDMEELYIPDAVDAFKRVMDHARINSHMEVVVYGSPVLINVLLPFIDVLEVYVNRLPAENTIDKGRFAKMVHAAASFAKTFNIGNCNLVVTKQFITPSYKYYNITNLNPVEIKNE